jgi:hypothetical protein
VNDAANRLAIDDDGGMPQKIGVVARSELGGIFFVRISTDRQVGRKIPDPK